MTSGEGNAGKRAVPLIRYLRLPEKEGEEAYLEGIRCRKCGETYLEVARRAVCIKCYSRDMETVALGRKGELWSFTVIHQSGPNVPVPYIAAVVKLPEGPFVKANIVGCEIKPESVYAGMPLEMVTQKVREDALGNDIIAFQYRPA